MENNENNILHADENSDVSSKTTKAELELRVNEVIDLIRQNKNTHEIVRHGMQKWNVAESTIRRYYTNAIAKFKENSAQDLLEVKLTQIAGLERDRDEAYLNYETSVDGVDRARFFKIYLQIKEIIKSYYPELGDIKQQQNTQIIINIDSDDENL